MEPTEPLTEKQDTKEEDVVEGNTVKFHDHLAIWILCASTCALSCVPQLVTDPSLDMCYLELKQIKEVFTYKKDQNDQRRWSDSFKRIKKIVKGLLSDVDALYDILQFCGGVLN